MRIVNKPAARGPACSFPRNNYLASMLQLGLSASGFVMRTALQTVRLAVVIFSPIAVRLWTLDLLDRFGPSRDVLGEILFLLFGSVVAVATGVLLLRLWPYRR